MWNSRPSSDWLYLSNLISIKLIFQTFISLKSLLINKNTTFLQTKSYQNSNYEFLFLNFFEILSQKVQSSK